MVTKKTKKTLTEVVQNLPVDRQEKINTRTQKLLEQQDNSGVVKGSHLTVTTFSDGTIKLDWDDEALLNEIRKATKGN